MYAFRNGVKLTADPDRHVNTTAGSRNSSRDKFRHRIDLRVQVKGWRALQFCYVEFRDVVGRGLLTSTQVFGRRVRRRLPVIDTTDLNVNEKAFWRNNRINSIIFDNFSVKKMFSIVKQKNIWKRFLTFSNSINSNQLYAKNDRVIYVNYFYG